MSLIRGRLSSLIYPTPVVHMDLPCPADKGVTPEFWLRCRRDNGQVSGHFKRILFLL
ncbi:unnamed protein product [Protopolystoma xenopodis]|uniref:Uncharacterized protein n=1 Tax=Protopolystoma xenopodis TaxID=117903 RepID=A0A3S5C2C9_9PLAT|nr:unnamed protein product [Protopolystoma xenopodis]